MDTQHLIERSKDGDWQAFADLVRQHQNLVLGYAFAMLGDMHLAEDAAQETFVAAYLRLHTLRSAEAFPWWLRGITRHQCSRILRKRQHPSVSLDAAVTVATDTASLDDDLIARSVADEVVAAINLLPQPEREVIALVYARDASRRQIADFLGIPITTVNNRLHSARKQLKRRLLPMAKDMFASHALPDDFATSIGKLLEVRGPLLELEFPADQRPPLLSVVTLAGENGATYEATVAQHLAGRRIRGIASDPALALAPGANARASGTWVTRPLAPATLGALLHQFAGPAEAQMEIIETGIKSIDVCMPLPNGARVAILGPMGVGKIVLIEEILHNLRERAADVSLFTFVRPGAEIDVVQASIAETAAQPVDLAPMIALPSDDPRQLGGLEDIFDVVIALSVERAANQLWPAVDVLRSRSRLLDSAIVGREHVEIARGARALLQQHADLNERIRRGDVYQLSPDDQAVLRRGRRMERFLTQPFFVAAPFTKRPGVSVRLAESLTGCAAILAGECDDLPESAFLFSGTVDDVRAQAQAGAA